MCRSRILRLVIAGVLAAGMLAYCSGLVLPAWYAERAERGLRSGHAHYSDLYMVWRGVRAFLFEHQDPYSHGITEDIQVGIYGRTLTNEYGAFSYPATIAFVFGPLAALPFAAAKIVFLFLIVAGTAASLRWWSRVTQVPLRGLDFMAAGLLLFTSYPALHGLYLQQPGLLVAALLALAMLCVVRRHFTAAGLLLGIATVKPQMVALLAVALGIWITGDWRARKRLALSFLATAASLMAAATAIMPAWVGNFIGAARQYRAFAPPSLLEHLFGRAAVPVGAVLLAGVIATAVRARRAAPGSPMLGLLAALALAVTVVITPNGDSAYLQMPLLPAVLCVGFHARQGRFADWQRALLLGLGALVFFWPWIAASVTWVLAAVDPSAVTPLARGLPLWLTIDYLPFATIALLHVVIIDAFRSAAPAAVAYVPESLPHCDSSVRVG